MKQMLKAIPLVLLPLALATGARADEGGASTNPFLAAAQAGEAKASLQPPVEESAPKELTSPAVALADAALAAIEPKKVTQPPAPRQKQADLDLVLRSLVDEVDSLKAQVVVTNHTARATQSPEKKKHIGSKTIYSYQEGSIYDVHTGVDRVTDVELGKGEYLTNPPVAGDTVRWKVSVLESDRGGEKETHIIIKPTEEGLETNLILTTNRNSYHLRLKSGDWYMPAVAWNYPEDEARALEASKAKRKLEEKVGVAPDKLNFNYDLRGRSYSWKPVQVFDDGQKTYIKMPSDLSSTEAPALFVLDRNDDPLIVNYRVKGEYYIVDRLFGRAELRVGKKEKIQIVGDRDDRDLWDRLF